MAGAPFKTRAKTWSRIWHANVGIATAVTLGAVALSCPFIAHKGGDIGIGKALMNIHYGEFLSKDWRWLWIDFQGFALFFLIVSGWLIHFRGAKKATQQAADDPTAPGSSVTILWENGRPEAEATARRLAQAAEEQGMRAFAADSGRYQTSRLPLERWLVCVVAGENEALPIRLNGEKLPRLEFAIVRTDSAGPVVARGEALGAGLSERGARQFLPPQTVAENSDGTWTGGIIGHLSKFAPKTPGKAQTKSAASASAVVG